MAAPNPKSHLQSPTLNNSSHPTPPSIDHHQDALYQLLREVQLERFYTQIRSLDVTKVEHFVNVVLEDLTGPQVGMGAPAARRLLEAAKKRNSSRNSSFASGTKDKWNKNLLNIIIPNKNSTSTSGKNRNNEKNTGNSDKRNGEATGNGFDSNSALTCLISAKDIKLMDRIGNGSFGVVMRASWTQPLGKPTRYVAVKVLKQEVLLRALEDFAKEVNAMHQLCHPNLIKLFGIVLSSPMMMVTELAEQGSLRLKLIKTMGRISIYSLADFALQIATGMEYLEGKRLIHRDLAARNIFLTESNVIKIGDFGLMRSVPDGEDYYTMSDGNRVPFPWCAIESLKFRQFSHASDTWMYGVTLWEIFSFGQEPWAGLNGSQIIKKLEQGSRLQATPMCPKKYFKAMELCWLNNPNQRPTFRAMIKFFQEHRPIKLRVLTDFDVASPKFAPFKQRNSNDNGDLKYLTLKTSEEIDVIEGTPDNYWWKGQSQRTWEVGVFPRCVATDLRSLKNVDISLPVKNSFIHTGHQDAFGKNSWGNPQFIEKMFLEHPMLPNDVFGNEQAAEEEEELLLETREGHTKPATTKKDPKVDKITNLDALALLSQNNNDVKEDLLIDLGGESVPETEETFLKGTPTKQSPTRAVPTSNDLIDIKFDSILDSSIHETVIDWTSCRNASTPVADNHNDDFRNSNFTASNFENSELENRDCENNDPFMHQHGATFDTVFDTTTTYGPTTDFGPTSTGVPEHSVSFMDELKGFTEYKLPEPEAIEAMPSSIVNPKSNRHDESKSSFSNYHKGRYYSSVYNPTFESMSTGSGNLNNTNTTNNTCDQLPAPIVPTSKSNSAINYSNFEGEFVVTSTCSPSTYTSSSSHVQASMPYDATSTCNCCSYYNSGSSFNPNGSAYGGSSVSGYANCTSGCQAYPSSGHISKASKFDNMPNYPPPPPPPQFSSGASSFSSLSQIPPPLPSQPPVGETGTGIFPTNKHSSKSFNSHSNQHHYPEYRSDECRSFIKQLEKDFSGLGLSKHSIDSENLSSGPSSAYPNINPPPKSTKIRRPAPQPPAGQRKIA